MSQELYSVEQVAERLGLHVRTVRAYVRDGRLKALKIGKQYRIARPDLEDFAGPSASRGSAPRPTAEVSSIVEVEDLSPDQAMGLANSVVGAAGGRRAVEAPLRVETLYDPDRRRMKLILVGELGVVGGLFKLVDVWLDGHR